MNREPTDDTLEQLAGEYVLGTLEGEQRDALQRRLASEPRLRAAVDAWEQRLHPLTQLAAPHPPSAHLWSRIERSLGDSQPRSHAPPRASVSAWWNLLPLWRGLAATGLAVSLILGSLLLTRAVPVSTPTYLVVLVAPQNQAPGWVVQASNPREIQLIPLGMAQVPADKALEFWTKGDDWQGPVSLGLVKPGQTLHVPLDKLPPLEANQLFELTLEQSTGSAIGKPTGPVQFIGRAVKVI